MAVFKSKGMRIMRTSAVFAGGAGAYFVTKAVVGSVRGEHDLITTALAGCSSGAVFGARGKFQIRVFRWF
jgi:hypothetical protein